MTKKNTKVVYKIKWENLSKLIGIILLVSLLLILILGLVISIKDYSRTIKVTDNIKEKIVLESMVDDKNTTNIKQDSTLSKFDIYWDYVKLGLLDVNMADLKAMNVDSCGYIEVKGTEFSYPVVTYQNGFYKDHSFNKKKNSYGWIYLKDEEVKELGTNNLIYGNKNTTGALFANLNKLFKKEWQEDNNNFTIKYFTSDYSALFQIVSIYKTSDNDHEKTEFDSTEDIDQFMDEIIKKSEYKFKTKVENTDKILTLTTNSKGSNIVVHAKLIKIRTES